VTDGSDTKESKRGRSFDRNDPKYKSAPPASSMSASKRLDQMLLSSSSAPMEGTPSPEDPEEQPSGQPDPWLSSIVRKRVHTKSTSDYNSLDRSSRQVKRSSIHESGTQSAYNSRDVSPEKTGGSSTNLKSPYPAPPPSFFITPPRSPRHFEPSPHANILTSNNMMKLYQKLGAIDRHDSCDSISSNVSMDVCASAAIAHERSAGLRLLQKSASVDAADDNISWSSCMEFMPHKDMTFIDMKKMSRVYADAPLSETLPASIRMGELIITPGIEKLCKGMKGSFKVTSPKQKRKAKTEESTEPRRGTLMRSQSVEPSLSVPYVKPKSDNLAKRMLPFLSRAGSEDKDARGAMASTNKGKPTKIGGILSSVMDKKRLFGSKKSLHSVDTTITDTSIGSAIASAGVQASSPGTPSTYEPPELTTSITSTDASTLERRSRGSTERKKEKRRTPSLDRLSGFFRGLSSSRQDLTTTADYDNTEDDRSRSIEKADKELKKIEKKREREASKTREKEEKETKKRDKKEKRERSKTRDSGEPRKKSKSRERKKDKKQREKSVSPTDKKPPLQKDKDTTSDTKSKKDTKSTGQKESPAASNPAQPRRR